jgi:uncharacterized protein (TIGR02271 family)
MTTETIVAVFDTTPHAEKAIADLKAAGIPAASIHSHDKLAEYPRSETHGESQGFWSWLFGEEPASKDDVVYTRTIEGGGTVVTVIVDGRDAARVASLLETHHPIDIEERASQYSATSPVASAATAPKGKTEEVIPLAEERLNVGKRAVSGGTTRLRRYVVERPVEEQINLRNERVTVQRRPVSGGARVASDAFSEKTIEVTETKEIPVVSKTAHVAEEVVVGKDVNQRTETVRDTVRKEQVDVQKPAGAVKDRSV